MIRRAIFWAAMVLMALALMIWWRVPHNRVLRPSVHPAGAVDALHLIPWPPTPPDELSSSEDIALLGEIRNSLRYGKANSHPRGNVIWALDDIRVNAQKALAAQEALKAEVAEIKSRLDKGNALEK